MPRRAEQPTSGATLATVIIDYGMGNLGSVLNMFRQLTDDVTVSADRDTIAAAERLVLPGVGAFGKGMDNLQRLGIIPLLESKVLVQSTPILGICLGMQLFANRSEEADVAGLGWVDAEAVRFNFAGADASLRIPHMGWNTITVRRPNPFWNDEAARRFYFVHSYYMRCRNAGDVLASTTHGHDFASAIMKNNIVGVQFHPEKSHKFGMAFLRQFLAQS